MRRAIMIATVAAAVGLATSTASAQPNGFLRTIALVEEADVLSEARTYRFYDLPVEIRVRILITNESTRPIVVSQSAVSEVVKPTVRHERDGVLAIEWRGEVVQRGVALPTASQDALRIDAGQVIDYSLKIQASPSGRFRPGIYQIDIGLAGVAEIARDERGGRWTGGIMPSTSIHVIVAPPQGARERSAAFRQEGQRAKRAKQPGAALTAFERATAADPTDLTARMELGGAYLEMGRYRDAIAHLEAVAASQRGGERSIVPDQLAYAYVAIGDEQNAVRVLRSTGASDQSVTAQLNRLRLAIEKRR